MKKQILVSLALVLSAQSAFAEEQQMDMPSPQIDAADMLAPVALDKHAELAAQTRMDDAMEELNEKLSRDLEAKFSQRFASVD